MQPIWNMIHMIMGQLSILIFFLLKMIAVNSELLEPPQARKSQMWGAEGRVCKSVF